MKLVISQAAAKELSKTIIRYTLHLVHVQVGVDRRELGIANSKSTLHRHKFNSYHTNKLQTYKIEPRGCICPFGYTGTIFELGRQARPGRQTGIRLYRPVPAEGQNKSWGHRLTAKAITYQWRHLNNK
jgi:hypothetical protein